MTEFVIYKYPLGEYPGEYPVAMPHTARVIHVGQQGGVITLWAQICLPATSRTVLFRVVATGEQFTSDRYVYGTVQMPNGLVWHVVGSAEPGGHGEQP
jgi:hypothetical protein